MSTTLNRASELAISAGDGVNNAGNAGAIAVEVQQLYESAVSTANTQINGKYIFGGYQSNVNPIDPKTGEFVTDGSSLNVEIANGINVATNISAGSLFSFKRVNTTDSATAINPTYNWTNDGANTIPDADPVSALQTTAPTSPIYTINPGDSISVEDTATHAITSYTLNPTTGSPLTFTNVADLANYLNTATSGANTITNQVSFSYDSINNKFKITNTTAGAVTVNWQGSASPTPTTLNVEQTLGFSGVGDQTIKANSNIEGANTPGKFTASDNIFTVNGGSLNIKVGSTTTQVNLAANSTLQNVRDAINSANAGVKAEVVNEGTTANPDFRLVVASVPAGNSANIDISVTPAANTAAKIISSIPAGGALTGSGVSDFNSVGNTINFTDGPNSYTATLAGAPYADGAALASALSTALQAKDPSAFDAASVGVGHTDSVTYNAATNAFTIKSSSANTVNILWSNSTVTAQQLGFGASSTADPSGTGINMLSYDQTTGTNMTLGNNITNYNYITQSSANDSIVIDDGTTSNGVANNQICVNVGGIPETVKIARGTYTHDQLAVAIQSALNTAAAGSATTWPHPGQDTYDVAYDPNANKFTIASNAGNPDVLTLDWSNAGSTARQVLGYNATDESGALTINSGSNTIVYNNGGNMTATISPGTYTSGTALATAMENALNNAVGGGTAIKDFAVNYDASTNTFSISTSGAETATLSGTGSVTLAQFGLTSGSTINKNGISGPAASPVFFNGQSDNPVLDNYYNFNNNYLNGTNILRALNFETVCLQNNQTGRASASLTYLQDLG